MSMSGATNVMQNGQTSEQSEHVDVLVQMAADHMVKNQHDVEHENVRKWQKSVAQRPGNLFDIASMYRKSKRTQSTSTNSP